MNPQVEASDVIEALVAQRNAALDDAAKYFAMLKKAEARIAELEKTQEAKNE